MEDTHIYEVDISDGWDRDSQIDLFLDGLRALPCYQVGQLYCGFNADDIGVKSHSDSGEGIVYCGDLPTDPEEFADNPIFHAFFHTRPALAIYDPQFLRKTDTRLARYEIIDEKALVAIIRATF